MFKKIKIHIREYIRKKILDIVPEITYYSIYTPKYLYDEAMKDK